MSAGCSPVLVPSPVLAPPPVLVPSPDVGPPVVGSSPLDVDPGAPVLPLLPPPPLLPSGNAVAPTWSSLHAGAAIRTAPVNLRNSRRGSSRSGSDLGLVSSSSALIDSDFICKRRRARANLA
jgi:hypothetical protein